MDCEGAQEREVSAESGSLREPARARGSKEEQTGVSRLAV